MQWKALVRVLGAQMRQSARRDCALLALAVACLGGPAAAGPVGPAETFEGDAVGSFPSGWSDAARVDPASTAPNPSAVVVSTTDAFGNPTEALATLPKKLGILPATGRTQGIYRAIRPSGFYSTNADVRIDRFSDFSNFDCGCPPAALAATDFTMQVGFAELQGKTDFSEIPTLAVYASAKTQGACLHTRPMSLPTSTSVCRLR